MQTERRGVGWGGGGYMSKSVYVCVFRDIELFRYIQFSSSLCVNVKDRTTALISSWNE